MTTCDLSVDGTLPTWTYQINLITLDEKYYEYEVKEVEPKKIEE